MKIPFVKHAINSKSGPLGLPSNRLILFVLLAGFVVLLSIPAKAQNYIVNYYGLNLDARDLVYYPAQKQFIVSTRLEGELGSINSEGQYNSLFKNKQLMGSAAIKIRGNTLYALTNPVKNVTGSAAPSKHQLVKLNLSDNKVESVYELDKLFKGPHFLSDLTIDPNGVIYISDALSPVIYKIDKEGRGSVLLENSLLAGKTGQAKAIAFHKHDYLLVAVDRQVLKVDLKTLAVYIVDIETDFDNINTIHFTKEYLLVVSEGNRSGKVHILNTSNSWVKGNVLRTDIWNYKNPVNIEFVDNRIYILDSEADLLNTPDFSVRVIDLNKLPSSKKKKARIIAGDVTILKKDF